MIRSTVSRIGRIAAIAGISALAVLGTATAASATTTGGGPLPVGGQTCTGQQYASYQVSGYGTATGQLPAGGAKLKLLRNGAVVANTPSRVNSAVLEGRTSWGTFWGPGYYQLCANNTGNATTNVSLQLRTDGEFA